MLIWETNIVSSIGKYSLPLYAFSQKVFCLQIFCAMLWFYCFFIFAKMIITEAIVQILVPGYYFVQLHIGN